MHKGNPITAGMLVEEAPGIEWGVSGL